MLLIIPVVLDVWEVGSTWDCFTVVVVLVPPPVLASFGESEQLRLE